jgi:hypothetical protein
VVKARLIALGAETEYSEKYIVRVVSEAATAYAKAEGLETNKKGAGRKADLPSPQAAKAALTAYDTIAGGGVVPSKKVLTACAKFLMALANDKTTLAEVREVANAKPAPAPATAGKVVSMPAPATVKA